jgi:hypothetical protein
MQWPDVKAELVASVGNDLPTGYRFIKSQESFERKSQNEIRFIFLGFVAKKDVLHYMQMWSGIQNREIEELFHRTSGVDKKYRRNYSVVNVGMDYHLDLDTKPRIAKAKQEARRFVQDFVLPFLEKEYRISDYSRLLNTNPSEPCPYHGNMENRCHYGLICAKLAGDPRYETAKEKYATFLRTTNNGFYHARFLSLVADLERERT